MNKKLEQRITRLEKAILHKRSASNHFLEKRIAKLESIISPTAAKFVYIIRSTMTGDSFYFISDDKSKLKSLINRITDLFLESVHCEDDLEHDRLFNQLMNLCYKNNIQYEDDMNKSPLMTYAEYLESIGIDPEEDEYNKSVRLDEVIIVDDNDNPYTLETVGRYSDRF